MDGVGSRSTYSPATKPRTWLRMGMLAFCPEIEGKTHLIHFHEVLQTKKRKDISFRFQFFKFYRSKNVCGSLVFLVPADISNRFREDEGRLFQAYNDEREIERLDIQHHAMKASMGGHNYLAPLRNVLPNGGEGRRVIDLGTGTGIWAIEIAIEFPRSEVVGVDLSPIFREGELPDNVQFTVEDASAGLSFPDGSFDVVTSRFIMAGVRDFILAPIILLVFLGNQCNLFCLDIRSSNRLSGGLKGSIRNWTSFIAETVRLLRPGGLLYIIDAEFPWRIRDIPQDEETQRMVGPGFIKFVDYLTRTFDGRGYDILCGSRTIPQVMREHPELGHVTTIESYLPLWGWSSDPYMKRAGEIMLADSREIPDTSAVAVPHEESRVGLMRDRQSRH
ncbi:hypothetical protein TREMEDRAFT_63813 [Tremella mesenterica DSM 1558]|uniref:uncharacterized protein n=1 Tax=Tremella mesenterica (strain ATCC 24925 / CBS 8224 / DSM 1558 / NBRC 9311 / NRRL Y-6157 / RJB 2259-6 / UBC 559-6) TaxID=578456 RepID=UPI0003F4A089|nr:uncharacterized protein TREMEDRAFT_63813 [Tremella mesenterica DSM 1558]EIW67925.1 hypothetical protein TREMEDRAFT_63813 [Tremella mesenterica DSM 1558]